MKIGIIGGGINGLMAAYYLQKAGQQVSIIEAGNFTDGCSFGNAGMIVPSHIVPLAQPGMIAKGLQWMLNAKSPFYVKPRLNAELLKWGCLFWKNSTHQHVERSIPVLRDISLLSKQLFQDLAQQIDFSWQEKGLLMVYKNATTQHEMAEEAKLANRAGIDAQILSGDEIQDLEQEVVINVRGGVYFPGDAHINPNLLIANLLKHLRNVGVAILENESVLDFEHANGKLTQIITDKTARNFDEVLITTGAWSANLAKKLGFSLPMQGGKGYSMTQTTVQKISIPTIMLEARATATPIGNAIRFAGTMEIAGTNLNVNMKRVAGIVEGVRQYYPAIGLEMPQPEKVWRGLRPCSPDGIPYIGRVRGFENLSVASGHGMMGMSLASATGKLIAQTILGEKTDMSIDAFDVKRFEG